MTIKKYTVLYSIVLDEEIGHKTYTFCNRVGEMVDNFEDASDSTWECAMELYAEDSTGEISRGRNTDHNVMVF